MDDQTVARRLLACLDLTSLNDDDTAERIDALCDRALDDRFGVRPAAVCVFPQFVPQAFRRLDGSGVAVATVVNFPHGGTHWDSILAETKKALADGADEIDLVIPFRAVLSGDLFLVRDLVEAVAGVCHSHEPPTHLKTILETGALEDDFSITRASRLAVEKGADFLKTSTGRVPVGATPEAAASMLRVIVEHRAATGRLVGLKVSGGVRTVADAAVYLQMFDEALAPVTAHPDNFRVGASSLYDDIVRVLS
ncbi:MAG: deoxyribose-phosphate aldolase [Actinobacteria bacterium]|uniref:deoxyribose-phosphate aldolase n=1 Tax=freshwater metagenome TaxID=449393 RepID=A0A6J7URY7_9ZZZZ|nr:deoxyribose-phosphate aldolase [Actinomycetota bacterium]